MISAFFSQRHARWRTPSPLLQIVDELAGLLGFF